MNKQTDRELLSKLLIPNRQFNLLEIMKNYQIDLKTCFDLFTDLVKNEIITEVTSGNYQVANDQKKIDTYVQTSSSPRRKINNNDTLSVEDAILTDDIIKTKKDEIIDDLSSMIRRKKKPNN